MLTKTQKAFVAQYSYEQRAAMLGVLDEYRSQLITRVRAEERVPQLFLTYIKEVQDILRQRRLPPEVLAEISRIMMETFDALRELAKDFQSGSDVEREAKRVIEVVKKLARIVIPEGKTPKLNVLRIPTAEVLHNNIPDEYLRQRIDGSLGRLVLPSGACGYKGGVARLALKFHAYKTCLDFDRVLLDAELPLSDKDAVFGPGVNAWELATAMGVDPDGVERVERLDEEGIFIHLNSRDIDMNQVFLTREWLYLTPEALASVRSGIIHCAGRAKTLFGVDTLQYKKRLYYTNKILNRLVLVVIRGRAHYFELPRYNCDVALGIYWLVLIRKVWGKSISADHIAMIYNCAQQMRQTMAPTPKEFIRELMEKFRFFSFATHQTAADVARWILTKYTTMIHRHLKSVFQLHLKWDLTSDDKTPVRIRPTCEEVPVAQRLEALEFVNALAAAQGVQPPSSLSSQRVS